MRSSIVLALAAVAAIALPVRGQAEVLTADAAALAGCQWQVLGSFPSLAPRGIAVATDGAVLLAADDFSDPAHPAAVVLRLPATGDWQLVDRVLPAGARDSTARALHVAADGKAYLLLSVSGDDGIPRLQLRRSLAGGTAGSWQSTEASWPFARGGGLTSTPDGRVWVAYGFGGADGIGWRVESALLGGGVFQREDELRVTGFDAAIPFDLERTADGSLLVVGQLKGNPDEWVVRARLAKNKKRNKLEWATLDRFRLSPTAYGLTPTAVAQLRNGSFLVAGLGVPGGGADDYRWLERQRPRNQNKWQTRSYQLSAGRTSMAHDAALTGSGVAVLGVGHSSAGTTLVLRESLDGGGSWQTALQLPGVTDLWAARLAVRGGDARVAAQIDGAAAVIACSVR